MPAYEFTLIVRDHEPLTDALANALFEAGCDDGTPGTLDGRLEIGFTREADNHVDAVATAIRDVRKVVGLTATIEVSKWP